MEFRTPIQIPTADFNLRLPSTILTIGSCFAEVMGTRLQENKFSVLVNPFGTLFNPVSIAKALAFSLGTEIASPERSVEANNYWYHYDFHSRLAASSQEELQASIQQSIRQTAVFLQSTGCLVLTLGTAVVYQLQRDRQVVANCHKVAANQFQQRLLSLPEVLSPLEILFSQVAQRYPALKIILTVSPVRHIKDTLQVNSVSKALLRVACHQLASQFASVSYFPAYEILMDDLRDYRFYKPDMIHPSEVAEDYIWQQFVQTYLDSPTQQFLQQWNKIRQALSHRPIQEQAPTYAKFLKNLEVKLVSLAATVDVAKELEEVRNRLRYFDV